MVKKKKKRKVKKKYNIKIITTLLIVAILILCVIYNVINLFINPSDTFMIENGKISDTEETVGYIIREETVFQGNNYKNGIAQIKGDGQKIAKGEHIFRYYSNNEEKLIKKISDLDLQIQDAMEENNNIYSSDITTIEKSIESKLDNITNINRINDIQEIKKDINMLLTKKAKMVGELSPSGAYIKKLISQRSKYEEELNSGSEHINATVSGVVSYRVDGLEEQITAENIGDLTKENLEKIDIKTGQIVPISNESAKIVNNYFCYIACILNSEQSKDAQIDDTVKITLSTGKEITATIKYISEQEDGERIITFKIDKEVESLISYRKTAINITWWSATGLRVPNSSILKDGEQNYIIRKRAGYSDKILVKVLKESKNYSIIENYTSLELKQLGYDAEEIRNQKNISLYDEILLQPTN